MTNVSWNNSSRADYYSFAYAKEFEEIEKYVGEKNLKLITWEEIEFLLKLRWHEDSVRCILRDDMHPSLNFYVGGGYVTVACHTNEPIPGERYFNIGYEASPPECFQHYHKSYSVQWIVRYLENNS